MSTTTMQAPTKATHRGRGNNRGRGGIRQRGRNAGNRVTATSEPAASKINEPIATVQAPDDSHKNKEEVLEEDDGAICWICAEPVKYYSVSECNHRTCHVCALRLRALYKKMDCTFCKEPQNTVIFTTSEDQPFSEYTPDTMTFKDTKLSILFETQEMMEETLILLRFNCPDSACDYIAKGWGDLKLHVRANHNKLMCDLCIRTKKVFAHEHALYTYAQLSAHLPSLNFRQHHKPTPKDQIEGGVHPLCEFCRECFFSGDELYAHMREKHEECFICKRNEVRDQYFQNYDSLERHFNTVHHPCTQSSCLARKFVVFNTVLDLQAHMVDEHGAEMSSRDKRDARRIQADFEFEEVGHGRGRRDREREQALPPPRQQQPPPPPPAPPGAVRPAGGRRREGFGAALTVEGGNASSGANSPANGLTPAGPSRRASPSPPRDVDPAVLERHTAFIGRVQSLAPNPAHAVPVVKAAIRGYRASESSAKDLISTIWNVLDRHLEHTASIINAFVDLLDEEEKKQDLLSSWKGFEIEQRRQFPDLVPNAVGAGYAAITSGRVLNAKHSTSTRSSRGGTSRQVWDRVAQAAGSSSSSTPPSSSSHRPPERFPPLATSSTSSGPAFRQPQRKTPWASGGSTSTGGRTQSQSASPSVIQPFSVPGPSSSSGPGSRKRQNQGVPPKLSNSAFPELPSAMNARQKPAVSGNVSLRNILGTTGAPPSSAWGSGGNGNGSGGGDGDNAVLEAGGNGNGSGNGAVEVAGATTGTGGPKGKKGKGKQKQTLFTLGSFPT